MAKIERIAPEAVQDNRPLGVKEAADFTGYSPKYIYKLVHLGMIPYFKPTGGRIWFKREDLEKFMFRGRVAADFELREQADRIMSRELVAE